MATDGASTFPAADAEGELNPGQNKKVEVDPVSSDIATSKEVKLAILVIIMNITKSKRFTIARKRLHVYNFESAAEFEFTALVAKEQEEAERKLKKREKKDAIQTLKTTILVSAIVVAVAGAAFAITKKLREK